LHTLTFFKRLAYHAVQNAKPGSMHNGDDVEQTGATRFASANFLPGHFVHNLRDGI